VKVQDVFETSVTRKIPPVIYFGEQSPEKLQEEVREYIITGGYPEGDPRRLRVPEGIHEQFVRLLTSLAEELGRPGGAELPACWISGFFGSGKSSFAKLLGLALDHRQLPNGSSLAEALLERDDSPLKSEFRTAWASVVGQIDSMSVVFEIGEGARGDEHVHTVVRRRLQMRLGYCSSSAVAEYELKLEVDGHWPRFEQLALETLGRPWQEAMKEQLAEEHFSEIMHRFQPDRFEDPIRWLDTYTGSVSSREKSVEETVADIDAMLKLRAPGKTVFLVVDEVSQYIHLQDQRMLRLQAFISALGQRLKGRAWFLATGQQKLEEQLDGGNLSKLKDRFPQRLRVHLATTNIRDVVHKRLLKKNPAKEGELRKLYHDHGAALRLYGYSCEKLTENDFLEVYPMLPGHVELIMHITSNLRARSSRMKGDDHAIRGLLQLLGELFRQQKLGEQPLGTLITLDQIYDIQFSALDSDVQNTMARLQGHQDLVEDETARKVAKAVALLQQIQEQETTSAVLVAQCLYPRVGAPSNLDSVEKALERLEALNLVSRSDKRGYRLQNSAEQEWARERESMPAGSQQRADLLKEKLKNLLGGSDRPKLKGRAFPLAAFFSDGRSVRDERIQSFHDSAVLTLDFHYLTAIDEQREETWRKESDTQGRRDRLVWVSGPVANFAEKARELLQSRAMVDRYGPRSSSLTESKKTALHHEQSRRDGLDEQVREAAAAVFLNGSVYFRARRLSLQRAGGGFAGTLKALAEEVLPELYQHFIEMAVTEGEMRQLLQPSLVGVASKFFSGGLGLLDHDEGKVVANCKGEIPTRIREFVESENGASGQALLNRFGGPPWGYPADVVKACVLGLLRAQQCNLFPAGGEKITSYKDPGVQDFFLKDKDFKSATVSPAASPAVTHANLVSIRKFFEDFTGGEFENDRDSLADAAFTHLGRFARDHQDLQARLSKLLLRVELPLGLANLEVTLSKCLQSRQVDATLLALKSNLDALRDGIEQLGIYRAELTEEAIEQVRHAHRLSTVELDQLQQLDPAADLQAAAEQLTRQLASPRPWRDLRALRPAQELAASRYRDNRAHLLEVQEQKLEQSLEQLKLRDGFSRLEEEEADSVLRLVRDTRLNTTAEAVSPALIVLRDSVPLRLQEGEARANDRLEKLLSERFRIEVVTVKTGLAGRELSSEAEVDQLLAELRERLLVQLRGNARIRLL
jgi:hypothetical protein